MRAVIQPLRYVDEKWPLCPPLPAPRRVGKLWEMPHSMFFPGFSGISKYISADDRASPSEAGTGKAAEHQRIFSLWTHPENLIKSADQLLPALEEICREAAELRDAGRLDILPMEQVTARLDEDPSAWSA